MPSNLSKQVLSIIITHWNNGERAIATEDIYKELINRGIVILEGEMEKIINDYPKTVIQGSAYVDSDAVKKHGAFVITWVNPILLD